MSLLYLDTARLGQACPRAVQAQLDFIRLSADDPSMYCEDFFRDGSQRWSDEQFQEFPGFSDWRGVESFKSQVARNFGLCAAENIFCANRSVQLVRTVARLMFRTCRNVLTSDLNWPHWQAVVADEAARSRQQITMAPIGEAVYKNLAPADEIAELLTTQFIENECDGLFLPAVNNLGIRLPIASVAANLKSEGRLRFMVVDAAQSFCHLTEPSPTDLADVTITGSHKWLRGSLPLGIAVCGRNLVAEQIRALLNSPDSRDLDDPLLRFSEEVCNGSVNRHQETVNIAPLLSANAAVCSRPITTEELRRQACRQVDTTDLIRDAATGTSWNAVETDHSLRSGIVLMRSSCNSIQSMGCEDLRTRFRQHGVALSAYPNGLIRISAPTELASNRSMDTLAQAFIRVA